MKLPINKEETHTAAPEEAFIWHSFGIYRIAVY